MLSRDIFKEIAMCLYDYGEYPAVRYKILFNLLFTTTENTPIITGIFGIKRLKSCLRTSYPIKLAAGFIHLTI